MRRKHQAEVLIIGAGPVGLFAAAELTKRDVNVQIIDEDWWGTSFSYALALHSDSLELLEDLDLEIKTGETISISLASSGVGTMTLSVS